MRKVKSPVQTENELKLLVMAYCQAAGIFCERRNVGAFKIQDRFIRFSRRGQSDLWGILPGGKHFECELKRKGKEPSEEQHQWLASCAQRGALAFWTDDLDEFIQIITSESQGAV